MIKKNTACMWFLVVFLVLFYYKTGNMDYNIVQFWIFFFFLFNYGVELGCGLYGENYFSKQVSSHEIIPLFFVFFKHEVLHY